VGVAPNAAPRRGVRLSPTLARGRGVGASPAATSVREMQTPPPPNVASGREMQTAPPPGLADAPPMPPPPSILQIPSTLPHRAGAARSQVHCSVNL
jgi:hypothetical protein